MNHGCGCHGHCHCYKGYEVKPLKSGVAVRLLIAVFVIALALTLFH